MKRDMITVARKEMVDILSHRLTAVLTLITSFYVGAVAPFQLIELQRARLGGLQGALDFYLSFFFLVAVLMGSWGFSTIPFVFEKTRRTFETLLTTPASLPAIWLGKTLAVFALSYPMALLYALGVILYANANAGESLVLPSPAGWLILLVLAPLCVFLVIALSGLSQMILAQPQVGHFATLGLVFVVYRIGSQSASQPGLFLIGGYLLTSLALLVLTLGALRFLTKERIVLSIG